MRSPDSIIYREHVSAPFAGALVQMCDRLGVDPDHMMAAMCFETGGTFDPAITNGDKVVWTDGEPGGAEGGSLYRIEWREGSSGTGLIQFLAGTARRLGTSTAQLGEMTAVEQLVWVEHYFRPYTGRLRTAADVYMAILWPRGIGRALAYVIFSGGDAYRANLGLDANEDGAVTKGEAASMVLRLYDLGVKARAKALSDGEISLRDVPLSKIDGAAPRPLPSVFPSPQETARQAPTLHFTRAPSHPTSSFAMNPDALSSSVISRDTLPDAPSKGIRETLDVAAFLEVLGVGIVERVRDGVSPYDAVMLLLDGEVRSGALDAVRGLGEVPGEVFDADTSEINALVGRFEQAGFNIVRAFIGEADHAERAGIEEILDVVDFVEQLAYFVVGALKDGAQLEDALSLARDAALQESAFEAVEGAARLPAEAADLSLDEIEQLTARLRGIGLGLYEMVLA